MTDAELIEALMSQGTPQEQVLWQELKELRAEVERMKERKE